jgi:hypothetical protein
MKTLFLIWMLGYPLVNAIASHLEARTNTIYQITPPSVGVLGLAALIRLIIYIWIAALLWTA